MTLKIQDFDFVRCGAYGIALNLEHITSCFITLGAHAQREYGSWVCLCVSVCLSVTLRTSHFSGVCSSHKGYDLLNGQ